MEKWSRDDELKQSEVHILSSATSKHQHLKCIIIVQGAVISIFVLPFFDVIGNKLPSSQGGLFFVFLLDIHLSSDILIISESSTFIL